MHDHHEHITVNQPIDTMPDQAELHAHSHQHGSHSHTHDPAEIKKIVNRLAKSIGHLESVKRMVEDGRDCSDVLIQLSAVEAEINSTGRALLKQHMEHCIIDAVRENDTEALDKLNSVIDKFMK